MNSSKKILQKIITTLEEQEGTNTIEDRNVFRASDIYSITENLLDDIKEFQKKANQEFGQLLLRGDVSGIFTDIETLVLDELQGEQIDLIFQKISTDDDYYFLTYQGLYSFLKKTDDLPKNIYILKPFENFSTFTTNFLHWSEYSDICINTWEGLTNPIEYVNDLTDKKYITKNLSQWIIATDDVLFQDLDSEILSIFSYKLLPILSCQVLKRDNSIYLAFSGDKSLEIEFDSFSRDFDQLYPEISNITQWLFNIKHEIETKHTLLNYQFTVSGISNLEELDKAILINILNSTKKTFKFSLHKMSKDTINSLNELKNYISNEIDLITKNTIELVKGLWRDFFISVAVFALNFVTDTSINEDGIKFIGSLAATYLFLSYIITMFIDIRYISITRNNRLIWNRHLYFFLTKEDEQEMISNPLRKVYWIFGIVSFLCFVAYAFLILILFNNILSQEALLNIFNK